MKKTPHFPNYSGQKAKLEEINQNSDGNVLQQIENVSVQILPKLQIYSDREQGEGEIKMNETMLDKKSTHGIREFRINPVLSTKYIASSFNLYKWKSKNPET